MRNERAMGSQKLKLAGKSKGRKWEEREGKKDLEEREKKMKERKRKKKKIEEKFGRRKKKTRTKKKTRHSELENFSRSSFEGPHRLSESSVFLPHTWKVSRKAERKS